MICGDDGNDEGGGICFDFFEVMQAFFFNCIKFGKEEFVRSHFKELMQSISKIIGISKSFGEGLKEAIISFKFIQVVLENCIGMIDSFLPEILKLLNKELDYKDGS